jgi:hypothetical protein
LVAEAAAWRGAVALAVLCKEAVYNGGAVGRLTAGVALFKDDSVAELLRQGILKALSGGVQCGVGGQLADAHGVGDGRLIAGGVGGGGVRFILGRAATRGKRQRHGAGQDQCKQFLFHCNALLF